MLCHLAFPVSKRLPSIRSAATAAALFADFLGTMHLSDFSCPCIIGFGPPAFPMRTAAADSGGRAGDLPVPAQGTSVHAGVSDHAGPAGRSR